MDFCQYLHKKTPKTIVNGIKYVKTLPEIMPAQLSISGFPPGSSGIAVRLFFYILFYSSQSLHTP
jgi:hypothetical protein